MPLSSLLKDPRLRLLFYPARSFVLCFCAVHQFCAHVGHPGLTDGPSMLPALAVRGDYAWISTLHRRGRNIRVGDIVSFKHPRLEGQGLCKRVTGMPGDFVCRDTPGSGSDAMVQVPPGHFWASGDNVHWSRDSREYGPLPLALIQGKVTAVVWPLWNARRVENTMKFVCQ